MRDVPEPSKPLPSRYQRQWRRQYRGAKRRSKAQQRHATSCISVLLNSPDRRLWRNAQLGAMEVHPVTSPWCWRRR